MTGLVPIPFTYHLVNALLTIFSEPLRHRESGAGSMAGMVAAGGSGTGIADRIGLGVIAEAFPIAKVRQVLAETGKASIRERDLPAHVVVYYVIALALYMDAPYREVLRRLLECPRWLAGFCAPVAVAGKSGISQARSRLGDKAMRRLHDEIVGPIATEKTKGARFKHWRLVSIDGSTLDVADEPALEAEFGRSSGGRGDSAFPQLRFVSLVENGTHVLFGTRMGSYATSEIALAREVLQNLVAGHAGAGGPQLLQLRDVEPGPRARRRPALAGQEERAAGLREETAGRFVSQLYLSQQ